MLEATGKDRRALLQRLTTNDVLGDGVIGNLFTDENGRIVEAVAMVLGGDKDFIIAERGATAPLLEWLDKMTFREDAVFAQSEVPVALLIGEGGNFTELGVSQRFVFGEAPSASPLSAEAWHALRVQTGLARSDRAVCQGHNPHEARLADRLNDRKGCYIGQEVVARLETYDKVQRFLLRLRLAKTAAVGSAVQVDGENVGTLAAVAGNAALAYVKKAFAERSTFAVDSASAEALAWPA